MNGQRCPGEEQRVKAAVPVSEYRGLESPVYGHFGSASSFALVDTETLEVTQVANRDHQHVHGACSPMRALAGASPDVVIVGGIGAGAVSGLRSAGIRVCLCPPGGTVADAVRLLVSDGLQEIGEGTCSGHGHGHSCH
jgi:predicted Fe-Mo cluster-binding NifX family protein